MGELLKIRLANLRVSFVVPCYKLAHLLPECIHSILSQTYDNFEVLIMDDKTFTNWQNHLPATPLYSSGRSNHASISLQLAPSAKRYYLVVNNRTSARPQIMQARLNLAYRIR